MRTGRFLVSCWLLFVSVGVAQTTRAQATRPVRIRLERAAGPVSGSVITTFLDANRGGFGRCARHVPRAGQAVRVRLRIDRNGRVRGADELRGDAVQTDTRHAGRVVVCTVATVRGWALPPPVATELETTADVEIRYEPRRR